MLGLGSGRRGARSPPLFFLLLALGAFLAFLALSYWVSSSRSAELQARVAGLDAKVRRAAADFSAAELQKHQLQLQLQSQLETHRDEVGQLGRRHRQQLESEARICNEEKVALNKNITSSTRIIQTLQEQFQEMQIGYSHLNQKLQELQKKLTYDITQCSNQINDQKELYEEQIKELNRRLHDIKFQPENRNTEAADENKSLVKQKPTEKKGSTEPSNKEQTSPRQTTDYTDQLKVEKTNELKHGDKKIKEFKHVTISTHLAQELENNKIVDAGIHEDENKTKVDYENAESRKAPGLSNEWPTGQMWLTKAPSVIPGDSLQNTDDENQKQKNLLDMLKGKQMEDYNGDEGNVAEPENDKEEELTSDIKV
ncbi:Golgi membrane protein 1 isoform X2 [Scyliorhinus canicula]|uniref:Golgi membrane protein 1 isoform X2 n=1 Tax=Scyliorhinus canicula TaxID=7830 RepID=UPI0018F6B9AF|nr:Golgi membrane protein 1 isoform X2 [Scyliorhinus canicula]